MSMRWTYRVNVSICGRFIDISSWLVTLAISVVNTGCACVQFGCDNIQKVSNYRTEMCLEHNAVRESNKWQRAPVQRGEEDG